MIKTYRGRGLDDPTATTRFDVTPAGFHAIVLSTQGTVIIAPASHGRPGQYVSYDQRDAPKEAGSFSCLVSGAEQSLPQPESKQLARSSYPNLNTSSGTTLRTYRLALAATAEFTQVYGNAQKGKAVAIFRSTEPSSIAATYVVAHELGHMFGALHTFNGTLDDCGPSRFAQVAYEPGSGLDHYGLPRQLPTQRKLFSRLWG